MAAVCLGRLLGRIPRGEKKSPQNADRRGPTSTLYCVDLSRDPRLNSGVNHCTPRAIFQQSEIKTFTALVIVSTRFSR